METKRVYEKYKHLDKILSDKFFMGKKDNKDEGYIFRKMLFDFWEAIKKDLEVD